MPKKKEKKVVLNQNEEVTLFMQAAKKLECDAIVKKVNAEKAKAVTDVFAGVDKFSVFKEEGKITLKHGDKSILVQKQKAVSKRLNDDFLHYLEEKLTPEQYDNVTYKTTALHDGAVEALVLKGIVSQKWVDDMTVETESFKRIIKKA